MAVSNFNLAVSSVTFALLFMNVACITNIASNKSESKIVKREEIARTFNLDAFKTNEPKTLYPGKIYPQDFKRNLYQQKDKNIKERLTIYNNKIKDNSASSSGYDDQEYGLYAPDEQAYQGYGYQDFDQSAHYGAPQPNGLSGERGGYFYTEGDYKDREQYPVYGVPQYKPSQPDPHAVALKGILIPLAGVALLGAAAALVTNPILLQLGVISGRRRKRSLEDDSLNEDVITRNVQHPNPYRLTSIVEFINRGKQKHDEEEKVKLQQQRTKELVNSEKQTNATEAITKTADETKTKEHKRKKYKTRQRRFVVSSNADKESVKFTRSQAQTTTQTSDSVTKPADAESNEAIDFFSKDYDDVDHGKYRFLEIL